MSLRRRSQKKDGQDEGQDRDREKPVIDAGERLDDEKEGEKPGVAAALFIQEAVQK